MIKKPQSKEQLSREIDQQVQDFLDRGSRVNHIPRGISGRDLADGALRVESWQPSENKTEWTYIPEVVDTLEKRRQQKPVKQAKAKKPGRPRRRLIYDDFGEPLRWVWED